MKSRLLISCRYVIPILIIAIGNLRNSTGSFLTYQKSIGLDLNQYDQEERNNSVVLNTKFLRGVFWSNIENLKKK